MNRWARILGACRQRERILGTNGTGDGRHLAEMRTPRGAPFVFAVLATTLPAYGQTEGAAQADAGGIPPSQPPFADTASSPSAPGETAAAPFGSRGQLVIDSTWLTDISSTSWDNSAASNLSLSFAQGFNYFVAKNFSVGLDVEAYFTDSKGYLPDSSLVETKTTILALGPRIGWNVPLGRWLSVDPRLTAGIESIHQAQTTVAAGSPTATPSPLQPTVGPKLAPWANLFVPLMFHPAPHFFIGFGPSIYRNMGAPAGGAVDGLGERTSLSFGGMVGGYWGGPSDAAPAPSNTVAVTKPRWSPDGTDTPAAPSPKRLGDAGQLVIMGGVGLGGSWATFDNTGSSSTSVNVSPSVDYFVLDQLSFGGEIDASWAKWKMLGSSGPYSESATSYGAAARVGGLFRFTSHLSAYPVARLGFGHGTNTYADGVGNTNAYGVSYQYIGIYAPLIIDVAPHLFAGIGPNLTRDLSRTIDTTGASIAETTIGIGATVGGYL